MQRVVFTAARTTAVDAPAVRAVRAALHETAREIAATRVDLDALE